MSHEQQNAEGDESSLLPLPLPLPCARLACCHALIWCCLGRWHMTWPHNTAPTCLCAVPCSAVLRCSTSLPVRGTQQNKTTCQTTIIGKEWRVLTCAHEIVHDVVVMGHAGEDSFHHTLLHFRRHLRAVSTRHGGETRR